MAVLGAALLLTVASCGPANQEPQEQPKQETVKEQETESVQRILFSVPSPLESALMIQECGIPYSAEVLHDVEKSRDYSTTPEKAFNMGVYITDLSYSNVFGQTSNAVNTFKAIEDLANQLDLDHLIDEKLMNSFDESINNKEALIRLTADVYSDLQLELSEGDMQYVNALIIAGAWVEGMYIITAVLDDILAEEKVVVRIAAQQQTLKNLVGLLGAYENVPSVQQTLSDLQNLVELFNQAEVIDGTKQVEVNETSVRVKGGSTMKLTAAQLKSIKEEIQKIRTGYVEV